MRLRPWTLVVVLVAACLAAGAWAGEEAQGALVHGSLREALTAARDQGRLVVVFVSAGDAETPRLLAPDLVKALTRTFVVASVSGRLGDPAAEDLRVRYHLLHERAAGLILTAGGALLWEFPPALISARYVVEMCQELATSAPDYDAKRAALEARSDEQGLVDLLNFHLDHRDFDVVIELAEKALAKGPPVLHVLGAYASALGAGGRRAEEARVLTRMIEGWPEDPGAVEWRIARAEAGLSPLRIALARENLPAGDVVRGPGAEALEKLRAERSGPGREAEEARIRYEILEQFSRSVAESMAHADWIVTHDAASAFGQDARLRLAGTLEWLGELDAAFVHFETLAAIPDARERPRAQARADSLRAELLSRKPRLGVTFKLDPPAPKVGQVARLVLTVENLDSEPHEELEATYVAHGAFEARTQQTGPLPSLAPGEKAEMVFELAPRAPGEIQVVVWAQGPTAGTRGLWRRVKVP